MLRVLLPRSVPKALIVIGAPTFHLLKTGIPVASWLEGCPWSALGLLNFAWLRGGLSQSNNLSAIRAFHDALPGVGQIFRPAGTPILVSRLLNLAALAAKENC